MTALAIVDVIPKLAAVLAPVTDDDAEVHQDFVDAVVTPCIIVGWDEPALDTFKGCTAFANLACTIIASRMMPGDGSVLLFGIVDQVQRRVRADSSGWAIQAVPGPRVIDVGNVNYLATRVEVRVPIAL